MHLTIIRDDITTLSVDAIVNSANGSLSGGGGLNGVIHKAAGHELLKECRKIRRTHYPNGLSVGQAIITPGYNLPAKHVIHTVGPIYRRWGDSAKLLGEAYTNSLGVAEKNGLQSIAFPAISTGNLRYPKEEALNIVKEVIDKFSANSLQELTLCYSSHEDKTLAKKIFHYYEF